MISEIKGRFKHITSLVEFVRHFRCWITANEMIIIRLWTKLPCKTLRNLIINLYDDVEVDASVPIYSYFEWRKGPFKVGKGYTVVGGVPAKKMECGKAKSMTILQGNIVFLFCKNIDYGLYEKNDI